MNIFTPALVSQVNMKASLDNLQMSESEMKTTAKLYQQSCHSAAMFSEKAAWNLYKFISSINHVD